MRIYNKSKKLVVKKDEKMSINLNPVRGAKDYLPKEMRMRDYVQEVILNTYKQYGFERIGTPIMEDIDRLLGSDGGENLAMIFKILKRGEKLKLDATPLNENDLVDMGLRYDLTVPLTRFYAANRASLPTPFKCIQIDKSFRAERPQKGRNRELYQCDIDIIGDSSINAEIELLYVAAKTLQNIGFEGFTIRVNDRRILNELIINAGFDKSEIESVCISFDKLDKIGEEGVKAELLEKGYDKEVVERFSKTVLAGGSEIPADFCSNKEVVENLRQVIAEVQTLASGKYNIVYDKSLVRGMGYYTGMVFEVAMEGAGFSVAGGGRYDNSIGKFLNEDIPAVGISIGFERICEVLKDMEKTFADKKRLVLIYSESDDFSEVIKKSEKLRGEGYIVALLKRGKKLARQLDEMVRDGYGYSATFGEGDEVRELAFKK